MLSYHCHETPPPPRLYRAGTASSVYRPLLYWRCATDQYWRFYGHTTGLFLKIDTNEWNEWCDDVTGHWLQRRRKMVLSSWSALCRRSSVLSPNKVRYDADD